MENPSETKELNGWLAAKMAQARLSAKEMKEFMAWLTRRGTGVSERQIMHKGNDVEEFVSWFKERIRDSSINESDKRELKGWLFGKLVSSNISYEEAERIKEHLSNDVDS